MLGYKPEDLVVFKFADEGVAPSKMVLYANATKLKDPAYKDKLARFIAASNKGWDYAVEHQDEAVKIVLDNDTTGAQTEKHQSGC